jgi:hypothetical protein
MFFEIRMSEHKEHGQNNLRKPGKSEEAFDHGILGPHGKVRICSV